MTSRPEEGNPPAESIKQQRMEGAIRRLSCFANAPPSVIDALMPLVDVSTYNSKDTVIAMGQFDGSLCYGIIDGKARLMRTINSTGDIDVSDMVAGDVLGVASVLAGDGPSSAMVSLVAETEIDVLSFEAAGLEALCDEDFDVCRHLLQYFAAEVLRLKAPGDSDVSPERRVYRHLLSLVRRQENQFVIEEMPRHSVLAEAAGVTDRDAAAAVALLLSDGIAVRDYPGLVIQDIDSLRSMC